MMRTTITKKQNFEKKQLYGYFKRKTREVSQEKTWTWLSVENLKREIEFLLIAAENNAIITDYVKLK